MDSEELSEEYGYLRPVSALNFDSSNWNEWQYVQIQGVDDRIDDDDQTYTLTFDASRSADTHYLVLTEAELLAEEVKVEISNIDDDTAGISVIGVPEVTEEGEEYTLEVYLNSEPTSEVKLVIESEDVTEAQLDLGMLTYTKDNYGRPQTVTLFGVEDEINELPQEYSITLRTETMEEKYNELSLRYTIRNEDPLARRIINEYILKAVEDYTTLHTPNIDTHEARIKELERQLGEITKEIPKIVDSLAEHEAGIEDLNFRNNVLYDESNELYREFVILQDKYDSLLVGQFQFGG